MSDILIFQSFGIESSYVEVPGGWRCRKWLAWVHLGSDFRYIEGGSNLPGKFVRVLDARDGLQFSPPSRGS